MAKIRYALCAILPLAWGSLALAAQPTETGPAPVRAEHHHGDIAAWHKEICSEHYARAASHLAYLQAKLGLSEQQSALFAKWRQAVLDHGAKERTACLEMTPKANAKPSFPEREAHLEKILTLKLQSLQATRPALEELYNALSDDQKTIFDHAAHGHHGDHGHHAFGMEGHMDGHMGREQGK
ncbi:MAG TPA: Spy/CpxP family protein refolding chaperone [Telmatospirillum sp.]|nr:Spy/CpxP family protein refolding chaperone [Telmatospirillum sp.]